MASNERPLPKLVVVERDGLGEKINEIAERLKVELQILPFSSVLEVVGESGPASASGLICSVSAAGPFLKDLLRWTEPVTTGTAYRLRSSERIVTNLRLTRLLGETMCSGSMRRMRKPAWNHGFPPPWRFTTYAYFEHNITRWRVL